MAGWLARLRRGIFVFRWRGRRDEEDGSVPESPSPEALLFEMKFGTRSGTRLSVSSPSPIVDEGTTRGGTARRASTRMRRAP